MSVHTGYAHIRLILEQLEQGLHYLLLSRHLFLGSLPGIHITKTCLFEYTENFPIKKWKFSDKKF